MRIPDLWEVWAYLMAGCLITAVMPEEVFEGKDKSGTDGFKAAVIVGWPVVALITAALALVHLSNGLREIGERMFDLYYRWRVNKVAKKAAKALRKKAEHL